MINCFQFRYNFTDNFNLRRYTEGQSFKQCSKCRAMFYCSAECQAAHWKRAHKSECGRAKPSVLPSVAYQKSTSTMTQNAFMSFMMKMSQSAGPHIRV